MLTSKSKNVRYLLWMLLFGFLLSACSNGTSPVEVETVTPIAPLLSPTPAAPTATLVPAAAVVNGERIPLAWFESEVTRYVLAQEVMDEPLEDEAAAQEIVLNDLIDQVLLAQAALESGFTVSDQDVQARMDALAEEHDLSAWMAEWGYTQEELFESLKLEMLAAYQRDAIAESVPEETEQVRLQQIFTYTETDAKAALLSLNSGAPFDEVAFSYIYDPITGGHLGWIPRGYLLDPAVEEAAFSLLVGSYSDVIESDVGYHILMVLEKEVRPLTNDARLTLQRQALHAWLAQQREESTIEVLVK